jgi:hypothetical protein
LTEVPAPYGEHRDDRQPLTRELVTGKRQDSRQSGAAPENRVEGGFCS